MPTHASLSKYQKGQNLWFHPETALDVRAALEAAFKTRYAVRLWLGDTRTGRAWAHQEHALGQIRRSSGKRKVPVFIEEGEASGYPILAQYLVRIDLAAPGTEPGSSVYRHPAFHAGDWSVSSSDKQGYAEVVLHDGEVHARFKQNGQGARYIDFITGATHAF